jgi:hypothetical protein
MKNLTEEEAEKLQKFGEAVKDFLNPEYTFPSDPLPF